MNTNRQTVYLHNLPATTTEQLQFYVNKELVEATVEKYSQETGEATVLCTLKNKQSLYTMNKNFEGHTIEASLWPHDVRKYFEPASKAKPQKEFENINYKRLFVGNIPFNTTWLALKDFIISKLKTDNESVNIRRVEIPVHPSKGGASQSRGFALVTTADKELLKKIIEHLNNVVFEGRTLRIHYDKFPRHHQYMMQLLSLRSNEAFGNAKPVPVVYGAPMFIPIYGMDYNHSWEAHGQWGLLQPKH